MKFHSEVKIFEYAGLSIVGNLDTGYIIGLNSSGAAICNALFSESLSREDISAVDARLYEHLEKGGFFEKVQNKEILGAYYHITQNCNLNCLGCYSDNDNRNTCPDPSYDQACHTLKFLSELGVRSLIISGGEPFLRNDLAQITEYASDELNFEKITIITNGTIIKKEVLKSLSGAVDQIAVSIDGYSEDCVPHIRKAQRFNIIVRAIADIKAAGINAHIVPTLHRKNYTDLDKYLFLAESLGASINFSLLSAPADDELTQLLPSEAELKDLGLLCFSAEKDNPISFRDTPIALSLCARKCCGLSKKILSIDSDGEVYPCHMLQNGIFSLGKRRFNPL